MWDVFDLAQREEYIPKTEVGTTNSTNLTNF